MRAKILTLLAATLACVCSVAQSSPIVYHLNLAEDTYSVSGTISTDGKIGLLLAGDIVAWDLTLVYFGGTVHHVSATGAGATCSLDCGIQATTDALTYVGPDDDHTLTFLFPEGDPYPARLTFETEGVDVDPVGCPGCAGGVIIRNVIVVGTVAPALISAVSRRGHGAAGTFDLPLSAVATNPTIEPRQGPAQTIVFTFDKPISAASVTIAEGVAVAAAPTFSGNEVVVGLTGVNNQQYVTVSLTGVASVDGGTGGSGFVRIGFLLGDVNQNRVVSLADLGLVNAQLAQPVTAANYLKDVNLSGTLSLADKGITNANLTKALPTP